MGCNARKINNKLILRIVTFNYHKIILIIFGISNKLVEISAARTKECSKNLPTVKAKTCRTMNYPIKLLCKKAGVKSYKRKYRSEPLVVEPERSCLLLHHVHIAHFVSTQKTRKVSYILCFTFHWSLHTDHSLLSVHRFHFPEHLKYLSENHSV